MHSQMRIGGVQSGLAATALVVALAAAGSASAYTEKTLHSFCTDANCDDGKTPTTGLVMDAAGNLYGTTEFGGKNNNGIVFKLIPNANKTIYTEHILKNFCSKTGCADGAYPDSDLIMDVDGNLYGTTEVGGAHGGGEVYKMRPVANGWVFSIIHSFCSQPPDCPDGDVPAATLAYAGQNSGVAWDETSPLFGATNEGGAAQKGIVYRLAPNGSGWTYQVLHSFNPTTMSAYPGPLLVDGAGNLFGVTFEGAKFGAGALYKLAAGTWKEGTLHNFCADANCSDGNGGFGRLAIDAAGNLFGATVYGGSGANCPEPNGCGVAFEYTTGGKYKVIYDFCSKTNCRDGSEPESGLILAGSGNLLGTTDLGGKISYGTVFALSRQANNWTEQTLYAFCSAQNCPDGQNPQAPVIEDAQGNIFGTADGGGANGNDGTVFELTP